MEWEKLLSMKRQEEKEKEPADFEKYPIDELEKDYQVIISSSAFRRLQDKTQVFPLDKSDFVRTRLTHSMEVSAIARQLGVMITKNKTKFLKKDLKEDSVADKIPVVLSCAGLLHDIGNPPFGHFGEVVIGDWFKKEFANDRFQYRGQRVQDLLGQQMINDLENFEGNAQALRILSKIKNNAKGYEMNLSFSIMNTLIKYPTSSLDYDRDSEDIKCHKLGYFASEQGIMGEICEETGTNCDNGYVRHPLVYLLEAADDIAYATADLEDAFKKGEFVMKNFIEFFENQVNKRKDKPHSKYSLGLLEDLKQRCQHKEQDKEWELTSFQRWMELVRKWLKYVVAYSFSRNYTEIMKGNYTHDLFYGTNHEYTIQILKDAMREFVYEKQSIVRLELSARKIINSLLDDFVYAVLYWEEGAKEDPNYKMSKVDKKIVSIISENYKKDYRKARRKIKTEVKKDDKDLSYNLYLRLLMVTDYISGMTDSYAKNLYQELNGVV